MSAAGSDTTYALLDSGEGAKLERFGPFTLQRPCSQAVWSRRDPALWASAHAVFERVASGLGTWHSRRPLPDSWTMEHAGLTWILAPNEHGNVGVFPEQAACWDWIRQVTAAETALRGEPIEVINLFGYSGGSSFAAARAGARVCHVDASRTIVRQARDMATLSHLEDLPVRWITDDALRFMDREFRRGRRYHGVILDPPTYGRGPKGEVWKIDDGIRELLDRASCLLADDPAFLLLTSHSPGYTPLVLGNLIASTLPDAAEASRPGTALEVGEMTILDIAGGLLPAGAHARWHIERAGGP